MSATNGREAFRRLVTVQPLLPATQLYPTAPGTHTSKSASHATAAAGAHSGGRQCRKLSGAGSIGLSIAPERLHVHTANIVREFARHFKYYYRLRSPSHAKSRRRLSVTIHWAVYFPMSLSRHLNRTCEAIDHQHITVSL